MELIDREKIEWYGCNFETPECESENRKCSECSHAECSHAQVMQLPSIKVPDNPTNGDMIKAMFPCEEKECVNSIDYRTYYEGLDFLKGFNTDWWNAPYRKVEE